MKRTLAIVLLAALVGLAWQFAPSVSPLPASAQDPFDPFGGPPAADQSPASPFDRGLEDTLDADPFGGAPGLSGPPSNDTARRGTPGTPGTAAPLWQRTYSQNFQIELTQVAEDGLSFNKVRVTGTAKVTPASLEQLPEVGVTIRQSRPVPTKSDEGYDPAGMEAGYGGEDLYGGGMGYGGGMSSGPGVRLADALRREVVQRVNWQAQADWVRQILRSDAALSEKDRQELKKLMRDVLKKQYNDQLRRQGLELQVVERRLRNLGEQLARRAQAADRVVDFELQRLDLEAGGLGLGPDAQLQPIARPRSGGGGYGDFDSGYDPGGYGDDYGAGGYESVEPADGDSLPPPQLGGGQPQP